MAVRIANPDIKKTVKATNQLSWVNMLYDHPYRALMEAYFSNAGPSAVEIALNYPGRPLTLFPGKSVIVLASEITTFNKGISIIYFKAFPGLLASVSIEGRFYD